MTYLKYGNLQIDPSKLHEETNVQISRVQAPGNRKLSESTNDGTAYVLPRIEAIHAGRTRNFNYYPADKLRGDAQAKTGVYSWLDPYPKPVIYNHDTNTDATGRILTAAFSEYTQAGTPGIIVIPKITDAKAIKAIEDKRLLTVSVGATTDSCICSLCGSDILNEGYCGHMKGETYDGQICDWIVGNIWFDELSWVNVPADTSAMIVDTQASALFSNGESGEPTHESALLRSSEMFGLPKGQLSVVIEAKEFKQAAENLEQEEKREMGKELHSVVEADETVVVEPTTDEPIAEPVADSEPSSGDETPVEPASDAEDAETAVVEDAPVVETDEPEAVVTAEPETQEARHASLAQRIADLEEMNTLLKNVNEGAFQEIQELTQEIKDMIVESILAKSQFESEEKASLFKEKLQGRSLDSLRDRLVDLSEGFLTAEAPKAPVAESEPARTVTKVTNPLPDVAEAADHKKTLTEKDKVNFLSSMLNK